jgi:hypothetical protein
VIPARMQRLRAGENMREVRPERPS